MMENRTSGIQVNADKTNLSMEKSNSPVYGSRELIGSGKLLASKTFTALHNTLKLNVGQIFLLS